MHIRSTFKRIFHIFIRIVNFPLELKDRFFNKRFTKIYIKKDFANWAVDHTVSMIYRSLTNSKFFINSEYEIKVSIIRPKNQYVFLGDQYSLSSDRIFRDGNIIAVDYQHGLPEFSKINKNILELFIKHQEKIRLIRVTNSFFKNFLINNGISSNKIMQIPLTIDPKFKQLNKFKKLEIKQMMQLPKDKFIIGSFQKDGVGWGKGLTPKYIKGPDIFLKSLEIIKDNIPNLFVLLTGPARGYVKNGLKKMNIEYMHFENIKFDKIPNLYNCLDLYLVCSRDEGGPYAVLESMASGVPIISTKVGMAHDLIKNKHNGFIVNIDDYKKIAEYAEVIKKDPQLRNKFIQNGLAKASNYSVAHFDGLWETFFKKLVQN